MAGGMDGMDMSAQRGPCAPRYPGGALASTVGIVAKDVLDAWRNLGFGPPPKQNAKPADGQRCARVPRGEHKSHHMKDR